MALFMVFEGGEGTGKSTQAKLLYNRLRRDKNYRYSLVHTHEPGGTAFGEILRRIVTSPEGGVKATSADSSQLLLVAPPLGDQAVPDVILGGPTAPRAEFLYFLLARAQLVEEVIKPNLQKGKIVISDRYTPSSVAYQGYGRGLDLRLIEMANSIATQGLEPDLIVLLDIEVEKGIARKWGTSRLDRLEQEDMAFHRRVREGYLKLATNEPERWLVIDATQNRRKIAEVIWEKVSQVLSREGRLRE